MHIFSGEFKNQKIDTPKGTETRPTSGRMRESLFNICQTLVEGASFLDLFAGSGAVGLEALSRGAASATFVDSSSDSIRCIRENIKRLKLENVTTVIQADVFSALERFDTGGVKFDIIFADPPYEHSEEHGINIIQFLDQSSMLKPNTWVYLEESSKVHIPTKDLKKLQLQSYRKTGKSSLYEFKSC